MPLLPRLDFARHGGLRVSYQCTEAPQDVSFHVTNAALPAEGTINWFLHDLAETARIGGAGSDVFAPWSGAGEVVSGPRFDAEAMATDHRAVLRLGGVAPIYLRTMVEEMRYAGVPSLTTSVTITGTVPLDGGPLSVRESHVIAWMDDPDAYPRAWPAPLVPVTFRPGFEGCQLRLELEDAIGPKMRQTLEELCFQWLVAIRTVVSDAGGEVIVNPNTLFPVFGHGGREFRAHFEEFRYSPRPAREILVNLLSRFHTVTAKIVAAEVTL